MKYDEEYEDDYEQSASSARDKSLKGYKTVVVLLAVVLVAMTGLFFYQSGQMKADFAVERDMLTSQFRALSDDYAGLQSSNDSLNVGIALERSRTDSVLGALAKERNLTRAKIRDYEKQLGTLKRVMEGYIYTIDSLGRLNERLARENVTIRREVETERLRADVAEERASDAEVKIRQGSVIIARDIRLVALNDRDREVTRASRASRLRVDFTLSANNLANPGARPVYVRVTGPEGYVLANSGAATFDFEGDALVYTAMREVDYQNGDLPVGIFHTGGLSSGSYKIEVYIDGTLIGRGETLLR